MRCAQCGKEGQESNVVITINDVRKGGFFTFKDQAGRTHTHDDKVTRRDYKCAYGHQWSTEEPQRCFCGWKTGDGQA